MAVVITDAVITSISIAYNLYNIMDKTLVVIVCSVYFGKVINTSRVVLEADVIALDPFVLVEDTRYKVGIFFFYNSLLKIAVYS